ncbi:hypothetical protein [Sediminivirga luteola]|uniref:Uncharacterized protein n=1 Tax=Sediminivirga luteola TaxID=1774748 RepID=A0A8J2XM04_9MICO|nr:hypothetical protein [Sediminivirga luteola]MCI2266082.1 hypothetical protein [Sediminivirga luteola]GGA27613.1 hypothetical protein GCM10011333_32980 [Sediminivirga luteola]
MGRSTPMLMFGGATAVERIGVAGAVLIAVAGLSLFADSALRFLTLAGACIVILLTSFASNRLHWQARWHLVDGVEGNPISPSWRLAEAGLTILLASATAAAARALGSYEGPGEQLTPGDQLWAATTGMRTIGAMLMLLAVANIVRPLCRWQTVIVIACGYALASAGLWLWTDVLTPDEWHAAQTAVAFVAALVLAGFVITARRLSYLLLSRADGP